MKIVARIEARTGEPGTAGDAPWNPWRVLRGLPGVTLFLCPMPLGRRGATDGVSRIWLDEQMLQVERRCALTHELIHLEWGHRRAPGPALEAAVRRETARRLIPWPRLLRLAGAELPLDDLAEELWVTPEVLRDRLSAGPAPAPPQVASREVADAAGKTPVIAGRAGLG